jgi:hypothetical protein
MFGKRIFSIDNKEESRDGRNIRVMLTISRDNGWDGFSLPLVNKEELVELRDKIDEYLKTIKE